MVVRTHLSIRDAQERKLEQKIQEESNHSARRNTLIFGYVVGNVGVARPDGCEQDGHTLAASRGLYTAYSESSEVMKKVDEQTYPSHTMARTQRDTTTK